MAKAGRRTALVTGAAGGIGLAVTARLLAEGVAVTALDLDESRLAKARELGAHTFATDLSDRTMRAALVDQIGAVDYLVNAAGVMALRPVPDVDTALWDRMFAVNAEAVFFLSQQFGERMSPGGAIVNVSAVAAKTGAIPDAAVYAASKAAVLSLTRSFASHLADRDVRVNAVVPGVIGTEMNDALIHELAEKTGQPAAQVRASRVVSVPMKREGTPEECAAAIWFLLGGDSTYITGQNLNVSGGWVNWG